uniref:indole-3-pyruvate monooxygenase n=1 Tax=Aegilops tauschii TaxID=37682 RepID=M8B4Z0_AEGTA
MSKCTTVKFTVKFLVVASGENSAENIPMFPGLENFPACLIFGDLSQHGITRPKMGPMTLKSETGRSAVIDVGTVGLMKKGIIKVQGSISKIKGNIVKFQCSKRMSFDAIVFATGYKSTANMWLKVYVFLLQNGETMLNGNGLPIQKYPNHWKGENGL